MRLTLNIFEILYNMYVVQYKYCVYLQKLSYMTFDRILDDGRLWAVRYDEKEDNCFVELFGQWYDMQWLKSFFSENITDLESFFHITDVYEAVMETIEDASRLECLMLDITTDANLDILFRHLENYRFSEMSLGKEKAKGEGTRCHPSWLRIYAIKIEAGVYVVTGGAIKLTATMSERSHTLAELAKLELVRNHFIDNGVFDKDGLKDYIDNE